MSLTASSMFKTYIYIYIYMYICTAQAEVCENRVSSVITATKLQAAQ